MARIRIANKEEYKAYLKSPKWRATRKRLYREYEYKCAICGSPKNLNVHHITYENLGEEKDEDLTVLCQKCHAGLHDGNYTFFDDLCAAWERLFEVWENETDETKKNIAKIQLNILEKAMDLIPYASDIYEKIKSKKGGK